MANLHLTFLEFEKNITLTSAKKKKLISSSEAITKKIKQYFVDNTNLGTPQFHIQGSLEMGTVVLKADGTYDLDIGVYISKKPNVSPRTLQRYIYDALSNHTDYGTIHKERCIRVEYSNDYNIDLPIYYKQISDKHPFLATKKEWLKSDPKALCEWFRKKTQSHAQIIRLVKYLKVWASVSDRKMPSGIALTVLVVNNYVKSARDEIALLNTLRCIKNGFGLSNTDVINPVVPFDDLLGRLNPTQVDNFENALTKLLDNLEKVLWLKKYDDAYIILSREFGFKFPTQQKVESFT